MQFAAKAHEWFEAQSATHGWVCMEYNDYGNAARAPAVKAAVEANGDAFTIWLTRDFSAAQARQAAVESGCSGIALEAEIPSENAPGVDNPQAVNWPEMIFTLKDLPITKAVVTNNAPFVHHDGTPWPEKVAPLVAAGWSCLTEAYDLDGDPTQWIERRDFFAKQCGWQETQPVIGLYGGRTLADFPTRNQYRNWSAWAAEYVL